MRTFKVRPTVISLTLLLAALVIARLWLPIGLENYVNKVLGELDGYHGHITDVDVALFRGAYVIEGLELQKVEAESEIPFLTIPKIDISVQWKALLHGRVVSEIHLAKPTLQYVHEDHDDGSAEDPDAADWFDTLVELTPIEINEFTVSDGEIRFRELSSEPEVSISLEHLDVTATDLKNVLPQDDELTSNVTVSAETAGGGSLAVNGSAQFIRQIPDVDLEFSLQDMSAVAINDFSRHHAGVDFKSGKIEVFGELAIADSKLVGYVKPMAKDLEYQDQDNDFLETIWEGFAGFITAILENSSTDTVATKVTFVGDLNEVESGLMSTVLNLLRNAWVEAFKRSIDHEIDYDDAAELKIQDS